MRAVFPGIACVLVLLAPALALSAPTESQVRAIAAANADYETGKSAIQREDWSAAVTVLESAARHDPQSADIQNLLGYAHRRNGNFDAAFKHYGRALEIDPWHRGAHEYMGRAYLVKGQPEKAKEHLEMLEKQCPDRCQERDSLKKAIADWNPWHATRKGLTY